APRVPPAPGPAVTATGLPSSERPTPLPPAAAPPAGWPALPGYEMLRELGRGGMGVVYEARQTRLDRRVAVKVSLPGADTERFLREARLLARIRSPYVVGVHDFAVLENDRPALVMEWVEGTNLSRLLRKEGLALPEAQVLPWMRHTCEAMLAAAEQGIIHRDLKPSNLLIDGQDCVRVADFGLALAPTVLSDLTQSGQIMGTPYYMAPEQAE